MGKRGRRWGGIKLADLGEFGLIELLGRDLIFNPGSVVQGIGDDTAVLEAPGAGSWLLFTTDMLVEGIHFSLAYSTYRQVGWKSLAVNLSDIAAMGGRPTHALVSLGIPPECDPAGLEELYEGLRDAARTYGVNVVGGDTVKNPERLVVNVALLGEVGKGRAVYRSGAVPGESLYVTGKLGAAAAGLFLWQNPSLDCPAEAASFCKLAHCAPRPRLEWGRLLAQCGVSSLDDISDGLASELHEICAASGVGCVIWAEAVPVDPRVRTIARLAAKDPLEWALFGGEDFELLFTASAAAESAVLQAAQAGRVEVQKIGVVTREPGVLMEEPGGRVVPLMRGGYDHFR